jgi:hypothetical protein
MFSTACVWIGAGTRMREWPETADYVEGEGDFDGDDIENDDDDDIDDKYADVDVRKGGDIQMFRV